jgi:NAD+ synthase
MFDAKKETDEIVQWIREYFEQNTGDRGCQAVVGLSGGKDSSTVAALCVKALGADRVIGVLMPQGEQWDINFSHELADYLGIKKCVINIKDGVDAVFQALKEGGLLLNRQATINTPARIRMSVLYAVSGIVGGRVANTCNLSEDWVGYSTKYGDSAGDFSPISGLTVTEVKAVAKELGLPEKFIDKMPADGLSGLSDEDNLGFSYNVLDKYIREGICEDQSVKKKIDNLHKLNLHKLKPMPGYEMAKSK